MKLEVAGASKDVLWPAPIERIWNYQSRIDCINQVLKRPDIGLSDRLFIASILNMPTCQRPWGIVTWLSDFYRTSRQTIYTIADSILTPFTDPLPKDQPLILASDDSSADNSQSKPPTADYQLQRAILKMAFPGSVSIRPMQEILSETLGLSPSIGFISQLLTRSGQLAGQFLSQLDYEHLDAIIALRDETGHACPPHLFQWPAYFTAG